MKTALNGRASCTIDAVIPPKNPRTRQACRQIRIAIIDCQYVALQYLHPTLTSVGATWLNRLQLETKVIAKLRKALDA